MKSVLWRVAKRLSYIEDARCLKVEGVTFIGGRNLVGECRIAFSGVELSNLTVVDEFSYVVFRLIDPPLRGWRWGRNRGTIK